MQRGNLVRKQVRDKNGKLTHVWVKLDNEYSKLKKDKTVFWHGSPTGILFGGSLGIHVGTHQAAKEALEARIGIRADGKDWDGTQEYGKTLLAGQKTLKKLDPKGYNRTGFNSHEVPNNDYYLKDVKKRAKFGDGAEIPIDSKPSMKPYRIIGNMTNSTWNPHDDFKANGYMKAAKKRGNAKSGYYYINVSEDSGSISAVVPDEKHLKEIKFA